MARHFRARFGGSIRVLLIENRTVTTGKGGSMGIMRGLFGLILFACVATCGLYAQAVDTTVCAVLKNPASFDGKTVRIKGTVVAGFDQFVVNDGDCGKDVNGIWLAYPPGAKAKSGPIAMVELEPAHNFAGKVAPETRPAVSLTRDKAFKQFDSLLAQHHDQSGGLCLGCPRYQVQATLVGRLDAVATAEVQRDGSGKIVGLDGFGNLNAYPARLVLESVTDVTPKEIDYSASDAAIKKAQPNSTGESDMWRAMAADKGISEGSDQAQRFVDPIATSQKLVAALVPSPTADQIKADVALLPKGKEQNGVTIGYGTIDEAAAVAQGTADSPDGVLYICTFNRDRLPDLALTFALLHAMQHVSDIRSPHPGSESAPLYFFESNAWMVTAISAAAAGTNHLTLPGGYLMWNADWPDALKNGNIESALNDFLTKEDLLTK